MRCRTSARTSSVRSAEVASTAPWLNGPETDWQFEWGREGEILTCPWHGIEFDITKGTALSNPKLKVRQYTISIVGDEVLMTFGS